jgi:hypothetical protein
MHKHHHVETIYFGKFPLSGYYTFLSGQDGYGGFNYLDDVLYMYQST